MNYYEHHIGDYQKKTAHLSMAEHGAYFLMMQAFYATEKPLPEGRVLYRMLRAESKAERAAIDTVAEQFWRKTPEGLVNGRASRELAGYQEFIEKQRAAGKASGAARSLNHRSNNGSTSAQPPYQPNGNQNPTSQSHLPSPSPSEDPTPTPPKGGADRHRRSPARAEKDAALDVWNQLVASGGALPPRDSKLQAAIDAAGGWSRIAQREQGIDAQRVQRDFVDAYRSVS